MNVQQTAMILETVSRAYPSWKIDDKEKTLQAWHFFLQDMEYTLMQRAVQQYVLDDQKGFAPSIGQLVAYVREWTEPDVMTESEAWAVVMAAVRGSQDFLTAFSEMPRPIRQALGAPEELRRMAYSEDFNEDVSRSNFARSYRVTLERERRERLPEEIKVLIEQTNEGSPQRIAMSAQEGRFKTPTGIEQKEASVGVGMPERLRNRIDAIRRSK